MGKRIEVVETGRDGQSRHLPEVYVFQNHFLNGWLLHVIKESA